MVPVVMPENCGTASLEVIQAVAQGKKSFPTWGSKVTFELCLRVASSSRYLGNY
jgi:hypothetical protein